MCRTRVEPRTCALQIALHVNHYNAPELQRHVVRIICMVPIYALVSWLSLRFYSARRWLSPIRECYESFVLYSFIQYLIGSLRRKTGDYNAWLATLPPQEPVWPFNTQFGGLFGFRTIHDGADFMHAMRQVRLAAALLLNMMCAGPQPHSQSLHCLHCICQGAVRTTVMCSHACNCRSVLIAAQAHSGSDCSAGCADVRLCAANAGSHPGALHGQRHLG